MGRLIKKNEKKYQQFDVVSDFKLQASLVALADRLDEQARDLIYRCYNNPEIMSLYKGIRASGIYEKGSKDKVHRKIIEFPNTLVYDFCDTVLSQLYGPEWLKNNKALRHELVKPWHVVEKL